MKLHLPKALLTAVLAACVASTTAWGTWGENDTFYFTGSETSMSTDEEGHTNETTYLKAASDGSGNSGTIDSVTIGQGDKLVVTGFWNSTTANFESLTIKELTAGTEAELQVAGAQAANNASVGEQNVTINSMTGSLSKLQVLDKGNLTLGKKGDTSSTYTIGSGNIASGATLTLAGGTTTMGTVEAAGKIVVNADATLKFAATDITHWSKKTNISLLGGKWDTNGTRQNFAGGSLIELENGKVTDTNGTFGDGYGVIDITNASITSSGDSSIAGGIRIRNNDVDIEVSDGTLTVDRIVNHKDMTAGIVKKGSGTLVLTSLAEGKEYGSVREYFAGNTTMEAGTIEYALTSGTGSYTGTISGTGNVAKSGAGSVTLANVSNLEGSISVTEGALTITSLSNLEGNLSVTGGALTITSLSNLEGSISVTEGALTITSLSTDKTMNVSVSSGSLSIGSVVVNPDTMELSAKEGATVTQYYSMDGGTTQNSEGNGFLYTSGDYVLFNGYVWNGNLGNGLSVTSDGTNTYVTANTVGTTYYLSTITADINATEIGADTYAVQGGTMNIVGTMNGSDIQYTSGSVTLANADSILVLDSASNAASLLSSVTTKEDDAGTIKLTTNATMSGAAQAKGKFIVEGATLKVEQTGSSPNKQTNSWLSSFTSIDLNNATVLYHGSTTTWNNVTVGTTGATLKIKDMDSNNNDKDLTLAGTTTLDGDFTIESSWENNAQTWKYGVNIAALTGSGDLTVKGTTHSSSGSEQNRVRAKLLSTYTGIITAEQSSNNNSVTQVYLTADGDINLSGLNIKGGALVDVSGV